MKDYLIKAYAFDGTVRIYAARTKNLAEYARKTHGLWPTAAAALGRLLSVSVIMGAMYNIGDELTIRIEADGPIKGMMATANARGQVRGYVGNPEVLIQHENGKLNVGASIGKGFIHVTKDLKIRDFFTSTSPIQTGEIAEDFAYYFTKSEQIPSAVALGVKIDTDNSVIHAGGYILQVMPGCKEETLSKIEETLTQLPQLSELFEQGIIPEELIAKITKGNHVFLETLDLKYACDCNKDKFARGLISLGKQELQEILISEGFIETTCHFCQLKYHFDQDELTDLIDKSK